MCQNCAVCFICLSGVRPCQVRSGVLAHDSGVGDEDRILVFGTPKNFELLSTAKMWFMDGTFKVTPSLFYQVYTVHGMYRGAVIPLLYSLLPNKRKETYAR